MNTLQFKKYTARSRSLQQKNKDIPIVFSSSYPNVSFLYNETILPKKGKDKENRYSFMNHSTDRYCVLCVIISQKKIKEAFVYYNHKVKEYLSREETIEFLGVFFPK